MSKRNSVIVECDASMCEFANGDSIYIDEFHTHEFDKGVTYCFEFFDSKVCETFTYDDIAICFSGNIYNMNWYELDDDSDYDAIIDYELGDYLGAIPLHCSNIEFWHAIYDVLCEME